MPPLAVSRPLWSLTVGVCAMATVTLSVLVVSARDAAMDCVVTAATTDVPPSVVDYSCIWGHRSVNAAMPLIMGLTVSAAAGTFVAKWPMPTLRHGSRRIAFSQANATARSDWPMDESLWSLAARQKERMHPQSRSLRSGLWWRLLLAPIAFLAVTWPIEKGVLDLFYRSPVYLSGSGNRLPSGIPRLGAVAGASSNAIYLLCFLAVAWWQWSLVRSRHQDFR